MENIIGIICEYNPFHNGHLYHLNKIKDMYPHSMIILIMPGYFTQRGDFSILTKYDKVKIALEMGIDLVIELPFVYATQSADIFAEGAIKILNHLKVHKIIFGSESNDINLLQSLAKYQNSTEYSTKVKHYLDSGLNYPTALSKALQDYFKCELKTPNDLLALSYIKAINKINKDIIPISIKRTSSYHSLKTDSSIISATAIRKLISENQDISKYVPKELKKYTFLNINEQLFFQLLKYKIISNPKELKHIQTVDEGIENRIIKYIDESSSLEELIEKIKTKRYTYNKIKRMLLHILCHFTKEEASRLNDNLYIRVLGFNQKGQNYLSQIKKETNVPLVSKLSSFNNEILEIEKRANKIFGLIINDDINKKEYKDFPIIL